MEIPSEHASGNVREERDINLKVVGFWAGALLGILLLSLFLMKFVLDYEQRRYQTVSPKAIPRSVGRGVPEVFLEAKAPLQVAPSATLDILRREEEELLTSYGWVNPERGLVHIPIARAIEIVAKRGLPDWRGQHEKD